MAKVEKKEIFKVSIEKIFAVLTDYASYPEFMDGVTSVEVVSKKAGKAVVKYDINLMKTFSYTLELTEKAPSEIKWKFKEGDIFKSNTGGWHLKDLGDGTTEVTYIVEVDFKGLVPSMITNKLVSSNLPSMLKAVEKRAKAHKA